MGRWDFNQSRAVFLECWGPETKLEPGFQEWGRHPAVPWSGHSISMPGSFDLGPACPVRPETQSPGLGRMSQRPRPLCTFLCWEDLGDQKWVGGILVPGGTGLEEF